MIPSDRAHLHVAAITHPGMSGKSNEDRYGITALRLANGTPAVLAVIADGVGGHRAGEVAAELAVETISSIVTWGDGSQPVSLLENALTTASQAILDSASLEPKYKGMGSTCACVLVVDNRLYIATAGDTRIYLLRRGEIHQLSTDHTWIQEAIENGLLTSETAVNHPNTHIIRRYLGSPYGVEPDTRIIFPSWEFSGTGHTNQGMALFPGDQLLLCSDGLTDLVNDNEINNTLVSADLEQALAVLVELANQRGGHDNITILGLQVPLDNPVRSDTTTTKWMIVAIAALTLLIALLSAGIYYYLSHPTHLQP